MTKLFFVFLLFLCFVCFSKTEDEKPDFFGDLRKQLSALNNVDPNFVEIPEILSCGSFLDGSMVLKCDQQTELLTELSLKGLSLTSIPSSISMFKETLVKITINSAGLTSLGAGFDSLENLKDLILEDNQLSVIPQFFSSFSKLNYLDLSSNSLSALPNEWSALTSLVNLYLGNNPSLQASTDLFKEMDDLKHFDFSNTLISGLLLKNINKFECSDSCVSSMKCSKNESCPCPSFNSDFCENKGCSWCDLSDICLPEDECQACDSYSPTDCPSWCSGKCGACSLITNTAKCVSECSWCVSSNSCMSSTELCPSDDSDSAETDSDSSSLSLILICVLIPVFVLVIAIVIVFVVLFLRKRRHDQESKHEFELNTTDMITLEDDDSEEKPL